MALLGQLNEFHLPHIIGLLQVEKQTGELVLEQGKQRVSLYFQDGNIVHALAGPQAGYDAALVPFIWATGKFHFESYEPQIEPTITATNAAIVSAGRHRADEAHDARERVTSMNLLVRLVPQVESGAGQINLTFEDWRFLTLVDGHRNLRTLATQLQRSDFDVQLMASRLVKNQLIELVDPRLTMLRMVALPNSQELRPPADPLTALMDDLTLDMMLKNNRDRLARARVRAEVLTPDDKSVILQIEGRPDLADRLLLSEVVMARLELERNALVHLRLIES
ncbi:MAG TPA: DUF4388 domain-containing protein [Chloroflexia bacterium]|nr:DUF4388 domain-containing protein [Chloroflexia bacterium]